MTAKVRALTAGIFILTAACIGVLVVLPQNTEKKAAKLRPKFIEPELTNGQASDDYDRDYNVDTLSNIVTSAIELEDGEIQTTVFAEDFDRDGSEEQIIAYRNLLEENNPIYITYVDFDNDTKKYKRLWSVSTGITKPGTLSLSMIDLTGDHNNDIVVTGMNQNDEQVLDVFKIYGANKTEQHEEEDALNNSNSRSNNKLYKEIVNIAVNGTITIDEKERSQPYQLGFANGESFNIIERARDISSSGGMDQIETIWRYNPIKDVYEILSRKRILGSHIEAAQMNELLRSGDRNKFEQFVNGLWYHVSNEGTVDSNQYIYFDTLNRDVIFYSDDTEQVYRWQNSYATRYGIYITTQNISVPTLNRKITIELESLDSISIRVNEDVRMKIAMSAPWNGSYKKAQQNNPKKTASVSPYIEGKYNSPLGNISLSSDGSYTIEVNGKSTSGKYVFFSLEDGKFLEFVPADNSAREIYEVINGKDDKPGDISLLPVRLGVNGIDKISDQPFVLIPAKN